MFGGQQKLPPYFRLHRQLVTQSVGDAADVPVGDYACVTVGPRHTAGNILVQNRSLSCAPYVNGTNGGITAFNEPSSLVGPRNALFGPLVGRTTVLLPAIALTGYTQYQPPEIDLLFWREAPPFLPGRADSNFTLAIANGQTCFFPTAARKSVRLKINNIGAGASATTISVGAFHFWTCETSANLRTFAAGAIIPSGGCYVADFGDAAGAPASPLAGENAFVPGFIKLAEAGATASLVAYVEAID